MPPTARAPVQYASQELFSSSRTNGIQDLCNSAALVNINLMHICTHILVCVSQGWCCSTLERQAEISVRKNLERKVWLKSTELNCVGRDRSLNSYNMLLYSLNDLSLHPGTLRVQLTDEVRFRRDQPHDEVRSVWAGGSAMLRDILESLARNARAQSFKTSS
eukprot:1145171-Pelagomonas_calceolata.AAC.3